MRGSSLAVDSTAQQVAVRADVCGVASPVFLYGLRMDTTRCSHRLARVGRRVGVVSRRGLGRRRHACRTNARDPLGTLRRAVSACLM